MSWAAWTFRLPIQMTALSAAIADVLAARTVAQPQVIHIWRFSLDEKDELDRLGGLLSREEAVRAKGFAFDVHRTRFIVGRTRLRLILGAYARVDGASLELEGGPGGKPRLAGKAAESGLRFNFSGSDSLGVLAVAQGREVGVDIERIKPIERLDALVEHSLSRSERAAYAALPQARRLSAFYSGWTRKEAFIKATGHGLSLPLDRFNVPLGAGDPAAPMRVRDESGAESQWTLQHVDCGPDYAGAVCAEGQWNLTYAL